MQIQGDEAGRQVIIHVEMGTGYNWQTEGAESCTNDVPKTCCREGLWKHTEPPWCWPLKVQLNCKSIIVVVTCDCTEFV